MKSDLPISDQLEKLSRLSDHQILDAADQWVIDGSYEEADSMLQIFLAYQRDPQLHPLFFLRVMNRFRIYTPSYCRQVLKWAKSYRMESEPKEIPHIGLNLAQALSNSPIEAEEGAKWFMNFMEDLFAKQPKTQNKNVFRELLPQVSRFENNVSMLAETKVQEK